MNTGNGKTNEPYKFKLTVADKLIKIWHWLI